MRRSGAPRRRKRLERRARLERQSELRRVTPLRRTPVSPASDAQRAKVAGRACLVCGQGPVDAAHLVPRSLGGCDEEECVVALCRGCHRAYDRGALDLLPHLEPGRRAELAHALSHLALVALLQRVSGVRWAPAAGGDGVKPTYGMKGDQAWTGREHRLAPATPAKVRLRRATFGDVGLTVVAGHDTMLRPGDPRWRELKHAPGALAPAEALRRGIELSRIAVRLKAAGRRALDERRA